MRKLEIFLICMQHVYWIGNWFLYYSANFPTTQWPIAAPLSPICVQNSASFGYGEGQCNTEFVIYFKF